MRKLTFSLFEKDCLCVLNISQLHGNLLEHTIYRDQFVLHRLIITRINVTTIS